MCPRPALLVSANVAERDLGSVVGDISSHPDSANVQFAQRATFIQYGGQFGV